jgi:hypothetical protein
MGLTGNRRGHGAACVAAAVERAARQTTDNEHEEPLSEMERELENWFAPVSVDEELELECWFVAARIGREQLELSTSPDSPGRGR